MAGPAGGILQGTFGYAKLASTVVLIRPGAAQNWDLNPDIPAPINGYGGYGPMNYAQGLNYPQWNIPTVPLDTGAPNWLTATNLNAWFFTRSARPIWDLSALSGFVFASDGSVGNAQGIWNAAAAKGAGFSIVVRKGQGIAVLLRFMAPTATPETVGGNRPTTGLAGAPLEFDRVTIPTGSPFEGTGVTGFSIQFDTGLTPNMELDGTLTPFEMNAGTPNCTISVELNALDATAVPGWNAGTNAQIELTDVAWPIVIDRTTPTTLTVTAKRMYCRNPKGRQGTAGRSSRVITYDVLATVSAQPLVVTQA